MLNTKKYTDELEKNGFTKEQANSSINVWSEFMNENFATKDDLEKLSLRIQNDMKDQTIKFGGMLGAAVSLLAILIKF